MFFSLESYLRLLVTREEEETLLGRKGDGKGAGTRLLEGVFQTSQQMLVGKTLGIQRVGLPTGSSTALYKGPREQEEPVQPLGVPAGVV